MTLAEIITRLQDVYGDTLSSSDAYYTRVINDAYLKICAMGDWWFLEKEKIIGAYATATTITATAVAGNTALILSAALPTVYGSRCFFAAPERVYNVSTIVTGTAATIDYAWADSSTTAVSIDVWGDTFVMNSDFDSVISVAYRGDSNYKPLTQVSHEDILAFGSNIFDYATNVADRYCIYADSSSAKTYLMRIFPPPDEKAEYSVKYRVCPATLSSSSDVPLLPEKYHPILVDFAKLELFKNEGEDIDRVQSVEQEVQKGMGLLYRLNSQKSNVQYKFGRRGSTSLPVETRVKFSNTESGI